MRRLVGVLAALLLACGLRAESAATSFGGESITMSVTPVSGGFEWAATLSGSASTGNHTEGYAFMSGGQGTADGTAMASVNSYVVGAGSFGSTVLTSYTGWVHLVVVVKSNGSGETLSTNGVYILLGGQQYKVTFAIPANDTERLIRYEAYQNGVMVGSHTTGPGDAAHEHTFTGLTSSAVVTLREVSSNLVQGADGSFYFGPSDYVREVNGGTNPVPTSGSNNTPGNTTKPKEPVSGGSGNVAPAPSSPVTPTVTKPVWKPLPENTAPAGETPTPGSPTGGVTNEVFREGVEKIISGGHSAATETTKAVNTGTNVVSGKLDGVASQVGNVNTSLGGVNAQLTTLNGSAATIAVNTGATKASVDAVKTGLDTLNETQGATAKTTAETAAAQKYQEAQTAAATARAEAQASVGGRQARFSPGSGNVSDDTSGLSVEWPGVATIDLSLGSDSLVSTLCSWIKAGIAWLAVGLFEWWLWGQLHWVMKGVAHAPQAHGNSVFMGTGAQATALIAAAAITAILVTVPSLFWAMADSGMTWDTVSDPVSNLPSGLKVTAHLVYHLLPWHTLSVIIAQMLVVRRGGALAIFAGVLALVRFVVP